MTVECTQFSTSKAIGKNAIARVNYRRTRVRNFPRFTRNSIFPFSICTYFPSDESLLLKTKSHFAIYKIGRPYAHTSNSPVAKKNVQTSVKPLTVVGRRATQLVTTAGYRDFFCFVHRTATTAAVRRYTVVCHHRRLRRCRNLRVIVGGLSDDRNNSIYVRFSTFPGRKVFCQNNGISCRYRGGLQKRNCLFRRYFVGSR